MGPIVLAVVIAAVGWGGYKIATGGFSDARFSIKVGAGGPQMKGSVPGKSDSDVLAFVADLELPVGAKIWAVPDGDRLQMRFSGNVPDNLQQRMRNYFLN